MGKCFWAVCLLLAVTAAGFADENFDVDLSIGWGGAYRPMEWTPVEIGITSKLDEPVDAVVSLAAPQDESNTLIVQHRRVLAPDGRRAVFLVTKFAYAAGECDVKIREHDGRTLWQTAWSLWGSMRRGQRLKAVPHNDLLVGLVGAGRARLGRLPNARARHRADGQSGAVHVQQKLLSALPWDWTGYACLDVLILYDPDYNQINTTRQKAIAQWVGNGGHLLIVLGGHPPPAGGPIAAMLPLKVGQPRQLRVPDPAQRPSPRSRTLGSWATADAIPCWTLRGPSDRLWDVRSYGASEPLLACGPVGFGRVAVLAFDPAGLVAERASPSREASSRQQDRLTYCWFVQLAELLADRGAEFVDTQGRRSEDIGYSRYELGRAAAGTNAVLDHLFRIPQMRPLSVWWVVAVLLVLAVLLGPIDYLLLKRLGRLPWTWVTSAVCVAVVTVGAYYGVRYLRAGQMQLRVVSVTDAVASASGGLRAAWATTYAGLFAPDSDEYHLNGLRDDQWWSGLAATQGPTLWAGRHRFGSRQIYCDQADGRNLPTALPIRVWSMQCLLAESPAEQMPFRARVRRRGNEVSVQIDNDSQTPIRRGAVGLKDGVLRFGTVPSGASRTFTGRRWTGRNWQDVLRDHLAHLAPGTQHRTEAIQQYLARGAAVVCARYDDEPIAFAVAGRPCQQSHLHLARLVVPVEEGPTK